MRADRLRVFVSSKMAELAAEREAIKEVLVDLEVDAWVFEQDAGARPETIEESYREQLEASDLYIGVFWKGYGAYTIDEYELARATDTDCLIYQKQGAEVDGRDPRLRAFLDRIGRVETGLTVQFFDTPDELREMVKRDTARWQTRIVRRYRKGAPRRGAAGSAADPDLVVLRNKVKHFWVDGVLGRAASEAGGLIELRKESRPQAVERPGAGGVRPRREGPGALAADSPAREIFDRLGGGLLILGRPGSGKTTTALELVRDLITRAERDGSRPVPVVFNLSAWSPESRTLIAWIARELSRKYHVPPRLGRSWIERDRLILVLDGLDEVASERRPECAKAIAEFAGEYGVARLVVTSRLAEYEALPDRLSLNGAILLRPLEAEQVDAHLAAAGEELTGLRAALEKDETLKELARTPLMVSVMSLAYRGRAAEELETGERESARARTASLFTAYVDRAFAGLRSGARYSREATESWLSWLARRLAERSRTQFLIEDLQPSWLATRPQVGGYLLALAGLLGLVFGGLTILYQLNPSMLPPEIGTPRSISAAEAAGWIGVCAVFALGIGVTDAFRPRVDRLDVDGATRSLRRIGANLGIFALLWAPLLLVMGRIVKGELAQIELELTLERVGQILIVPAAALVFGFAALGARRSFSRRIETAESLALEASSARRGALWGLLAGAPFAAFTFAYIRHKVGMEGFPSPWLGLFWCLLGSAVGAVLVGLQPRLVRGKTLPNQGMRLTRRTALRSAVMAVPLTTVGVLTAFAAGGAYREAKHLAIWVPGSLLFLALILAAWFGGLDLCKHYLLRVVIGISRQGPLDFPRWLNEASRRGLLQRVGGGYMFVHRPLLDHFAAMDLPPPLREEIRETDAERGGRRAGPVVAVATAGLVGAVALWLGLAAGSRRLLPLAIGGGVLLGVAIQWLVIRSAVASAVGAARGPQVDE